MSKWEKATLKKLGYTYTGLSGKTAADFGEGLPYVPYMNVFSNAKIDPQYFEFVNIKQGEKQNRVKNGDALFTTSSETPNEVGMSSVLTQDCGELYLNSFCFGWRLHNSEMFDNTYLAYLLRGKDVRLQMSIAAQGSTRFNLSKCNFNKVSVHYPTDTKEQRKIAEALSTVDEAIDKTNAIIDKYTNIKRGLMQDLLTHGEEVDFSIIAKPVKVKRKITVSDVCINMDCIESGTGQIIAAAEDNLTSDKTSFAKGDVLFGKLRPYLRKYLYCSFDGFCSSEILVFRAKEAVIRSQFLYYIVSSESFVNYNTTQTFGTRMPRTSWDIIKKYKAKLPKLEEQDDIIEKISATDILAQTERSYLAKLQAIKTGLMQDLLTNKVSVKALLKVEAV